MVEAVQGTLDLRQKSRRKRCSALGVALLFLVSAVVPLAIGETQEQVQPPKGDGGLMNSSWPMFHHDTHHTGRSPYGASGNWYKVKWKFLMQGATISSPAIDENGTIYIGAENFEKSLFAIYKNGTEKWHFTSGGWIDASPCIGEDGVIYSGSMNGDLIAFYQNGTVKWRTHIGAGWTFSSPVIGNDGTIYIGSVGGNRLCAVSSNGSIKWYFYTQNSIYSSPAIGDDGTIYFGSHDTYLYALYSNGTLKWRLKTGDSIKGSPSIGDDGTIYICSWDHDFYAINPNGTVKWGFGTSDATETSPAIALGGTIFMGSYNGKIYSIASNGSKNWEYLTGNSVLSSPVIDNNGIIYCGSLDGNLYALNPNGTLRWKFDTGNSIESSPIIGENGTIYIANWGYLYAINIINITNQPPSTPTINGPTSGKANQNYNYSLVSTDPDGNNISYYVNWGDGTHTDWVGSYKSGYEIIVNHTWTKRGTYTIKAKAMDNYSAESGWGTLQITMPLSYEPPHFRLFDWLLGRFPHAFPLLRHLLNQ